MGAIKDKLYNFVVRKNKNIQRDYEGYVINHLDEHKKHRMKHILLLCKLNIHYRIKKNETSYFDNSAPILLVDNGNSVSKKTENTIISVKQEDHSKIKPVTNSLSNPKKQVGGSKKGVSISEYYDLKRQNVYAFAMGLKDYDVISFDIFDTLLLRNVNEPDHLFMLLEEKFNIYDFRKWRIQSEREARDKNFQENNSRECTIHDIYDRVAYWTGLDPKLGAKTEFEIEKEICIKNMYIWQAFQILKGMGKKIYAVSNMYFPKRYLLEILELNGYSGFSDVIVSCDYHLNKSTGKLFEVIKNREVGKKIVHIGDNRTNDIKGAALAGIDARLYKSCRELGDENRARGISSIIGSGYYAILNNTLHNGSTLFKCNESVWEFGYKYVGLVALGYANWIHSESKQMNKDLIIFLSRDCSLIKKAYDYLYDDIDSKYLMWSRLSAIRCVNYGNTKNQILSRIFTENTNKGLSISHMLKIVGLEKLGSTLEGYGIDTSIELCDENMTYVRNAIEMNWEFVENLTKENEERELCYLKKLIGNHKKISIVDLGWTGKNALILKRVLQQIGIEPNDVTIMMMGTINKLQNPSKFYSKDIRCYMFSFNYNRDIHDAFCKLSTYALDVLEKMFSDPSCSFVGVSEDELIFASPEIENYQIYREISYGAMDFVFDYVDAFKNFKYLYNIEGYDAWVPIRKVLNSRAYLKELFKDTIFVNGIDTSTSSHHNFSSLC